MIAAISSAARAERGGGGAPEPVTALVEHAGDVLEEQADEKRAQGPGHRGPVLVAAERRFACREPALEEALGGREQVGADRRGSLVAAHHLSEHEPDEVLDIEHRVQDVVEEVRQLGRGLARQPDENRPRSGSR